jgi:hypothetical protein
MISGWMASGALLMLSYLQHLAGVQGLKDIEAAVVIILFSTVAVHFLINLNFDVTTNA